MVVLSPSLPRYFVQSINQLIICETAEASLKPPHRIVGATAYQWETKIKIQSSIDRKVLRQINKYLAKVLPLHSSSPFSTALGRIPSSSSSFTVRSSIFGLAFLIVRGGS